MKPELPTAPSRRRWIRCASMAALAASAPGWVSAARVISPVMPPGSDALELLNMALAKDMLGQQFEVLSSQGHAICELSKVTDIRRGKGNAKWEGGQIKESFSMDFRPISSQGELLQDTYLVHHAALGSFDLLLVPQTNAAGELVLLATFSRL